MFRKLIFLLSLVSVLSLVSTNVALGGVVDIRIAAGNDDVEQHLNDGRIDRGSSDLEIPYEDGGSPATDEQVIGLRFVSIPIPKGAVITSAYVEIEVDKVDKEGSQAPVNVIIQGELSPDAPGFSGNANDLTDRTSLTAAVNWSIPEWTEKDAKWQTSDISAIIQEILDQDGWAAGNALVLIIRDDKDDPSTGLREAESYNGEAEAAPLLHVEFSSKCAYLPVPADGAVEVVESTLEWTAGDTAVSHKVYLSTDETIDESDFLAETQMAIQFADLAPGTTYYWRVDEVEADISDIPVEWDSWEIEPVGEAAVHKGKVWSFTTMALEAHNPSPSDGATWQDLDTKLSWTAGKDSVMHDVYFGTDKAAVEASDPSTFKGKLMDASFNPGPLEEGTTYYWKVDEFAIVATNAGPLWSFTTKKPGVGGVTREIWEGIGGTSLDALKSAPGFPAEPTIVDEVSDFLTSNLNKDNYGGRLQAWLSVPAAGDYTFWVSGDDNTELYIGTSPADAELIAEVPGWTGPMDYDKYAEQQSEVIALEEGQYYLMALW